jgi:hypothetical protein
MSIDLLKPRYKVIANDTSGYYSVGEIIVYFDHKYGTDYYDQYPHLFRKLEWWEDMAVEDMPEYVKCIKTPDQLHFEGEVYKITKEHFNIGCAKSEKGLIVLSTNCYIPATETDYTNYINQSKNKQV